MAEKRPTTVRVDAEIIERAEQILEVQGEDRWASRSSLLRAAMRKGLEQIETDSSGFDEGRALADDMGTLQGYGTARGGQPAFAPAFLREPSGNAAPPGPQGMLIPLHQVVCRFDPTFRVGLSEEPVCFSLKSSPHPVLRWKFLGLYAVPGESVPRGRFSSLQIESVHLLGGANLLTANNGIGMGNFMDTSLQSALFKGHPVVQWPNQLEVEVECRAGKACSGVLFAIGLPLFGFYGAEDVKVPGRSCLQRPRFSE